MLLKWERPVCIVSSVGAKAGFEGLQQEYCRLQGTVLQSVFFITDEYGTLLLFMRSSACKYLAEIVHSVSNFCVHVY